MESLEDSVQKLFASKQGPDRHACFFSLWLFDPRSVPAFGWHVPQELVDLPLGELLKKKDGGYTAPHREHAQLMQLFRCAKLGRKRWWLSPVECERKRKDCKVLIVTNMFQSITKLQNLTTFWMILEARRQFSMIVSRMITFLWEGKVWCPPETFLRCPQQLLFVVISYI